MDFRRIASAKLLPPSGIVPEPLSQRGAGGNVLQQLVDGLNALGIGPRDLIAILQAIKAAGAIQAEIEVM